VGAAGDDGGSLRRPAAASASSSSAVDSICRRLEGAPSPVSSAASPARPNHACGISGSGSAASVGISAPAANQMSTPEVGPMQAVASSSADDGRRIPASVAEPPRGRLPGPPASMRASVADDGHEARQRGKAHAYPSAWGSGAHQPAALAAAAVGRERPLWQRSRWPCEDEIRDLDEDLATWGSAVDLNWDCAGSGGGSSGSALRHSGDDVSDSLGWRLLQSPQAGERVAAGPKDGADREWRPVGVCVEEAPDWQLFSDLGAAENEAENECSCRPCRDQGLLAAILACAPVAHSRNLTTKLAPTSSHRNDAAAAPFLPQAAAAAAVLAEPAPEPRPGTRASKRRSTAPG